MSISFSVLENKCEWKYKIVARLGKCDGLSAVFRSQFQTNKTGLTKYCIFTLIPAHSQKRKYVGPVVVK